MASMQMSEVAPGGAASIKSAGGRRSLPHLGVIALLGACAIGSASLVHASTPTAYSLVPARLLGAVAGGDDCNDTDAAVYPGHVEVVGNGYDDDCDGLADEDANDNPSGDTTDADADNVSLAAGDCNDHAPTIHPGAAEIVGNYVDDDCDGFADEDASGNPSSDSADHDGDHVIIAPDAIFASGFEQL